MTQSLEKAGKIKSSSKRGGPAKTIMRFWSLYSRNRGAVVGLAIVGMFILSALFAFYIAPYGPTEPNYSELLKGPDSRHVFGTDNLGRDIFSRIVWGSQVSLTVGFLSALVMMMMGLITGVGAGYSGGKLDKAVMAFTDSVLMIPFVPLILVIISLFGTSLTNVILAIGLTGWPQVTRVLRAETLSLKKQEYIEAAKTCGVGNIRIVLNHIIPNEASAIVVNAALSIAGAIFVEAAIDFLGLGAVQVSWGFMLFTSLDYWISGSWWLTFYPGAAIFLVCLAFYLMSEGIAEVFGATSSTV